MGIIYMLKTLSNSLSLLEWGSQPPIWPPLIQPGIYTLVAFSYNIPASVCVKIEHGMSDVSHV